MRWMVVPASMEARSRPSSHAGVQGCQWDHPLPSVAPPPRNARSSAVLVGTYPSKTRPSREAKARWRMGAPGEMWMPVTLQ